MILFFDKSGQPISREDYQRLWSDRAYAQIANDELDDGRRVSTVWLGLNHGFDAGPPVIFESIVFGKPPKIGGELYYPAVLELQRYRTEADAKAGHAELLGRALAGDLKDFES